MEDYMTQSIQDVWDKFERWAYRYKKACENTAAELIDCGYSDHDVGLCLSKWHELNQDFWDLNISESELSTRISQKINFIRGYLVDISFDGSEFMAKHSGFLTLQYPSKCNNSMGIWLDQDLEGDIEAGGYFGFQDFDINVFCKSMADIDLASMRNILPFDRMYIRRPKGLVWDKSSICNVVQQVKEDIEFDYSVQINHDDNESQELLMISFSWE